MAQLAVICVVLESHRPILGEIIGHPRRRREIQRTQALERGVEDRISDQINRSDADPDDRPDLARVAGWLPVKSVEAELEIDAVKEAPLLDVRHDKLGTQFC